MNPNSIDKWDCCYRRAQADSMWSEDAVPYVSGMEADHRSISVARAIDVPCGDGRNTIVLSRIAKTVVALDSSVHALERARKRFDAQDVGNIHIVQGDFCELPFPDEYFDLVFCWDAIGHLEMPQFLLRELKRVCACGGAIIGSCFALEDSTRGVGMKRIGEAEFLYGLDIFYRYYSMEELKSVLEECDMVSSAICLERWTEPPHAGYREYMHDHVSWVFKYIKQ